MGKRIQINKAAILGTLSGLIFVFLVHPFRFSEPLISYRRLQSHEILVQLQTDSVRRDQYLLQQCEINMSALENWPGNSSTPVRKSVSNGGHWTPENCRPRYDTTIVIPYRDRPKHLDTFLEYVHPFLQSQNLSYSLFVVEQVQGKPFNRGKLFNVGFLEALKVNKDKNCFVFHDIDLIPLNGQNIYACSSKTPTHLSAFVDTFRYNLPYTGLFGGAVAISKSTFTAVNGFSNEFFGWGGEDDDLWINRILPFTKQSMIRYEDPISRYQMLPHDKETPSENRLVMLEKGHLSAADDGLNNIDYSVVSNVQRELYTHLLVAI